MSAAPSSAGSAGVRHQPLGSGPLLAWAGWVKAALAALSASAGVIHGVVAFDHLGGAGEGLAFFTVAAAAQLALAVVVVVSRARWVLAAGILGHGVLTAVWLVSRTVGVPVGAHSGEALSIGLADGISQLLQVLFIVVAALWLAQDRAPVRWLVPRALAGGSIVVLLAVVPLTTAGAGAVALEEGGNHTHAHTSEGEGDRGPGGHTPEEEGGHRPGAHGAEASDGAHVFEGGDSHADDHEHHDHEHDAPDEDQTPSDAGS